jgi:phosphoribosylglycinamide formyltransferase 1
MAALLYASKAETCPYEIVLVASNDPQAQGLALAQAEGIATFAHPHKGMAREAFDQILNREIKQGGAEYIILAGYMRLLSSSFVEEWAGHMLNIHPSLLPAYKGLHTHERALAAGDSHGGCSVHIVTPELDDGEVLEQTRVAILAGDTAESLAGRVLIAEHQLYPRIVAQYVARKHTPEWLIEQVRVRAFALPQVEETHSHSMPCFGIIKGKKFAWVTQNHHSHERVGLLVKISGADEQRHLIEQDEERYFRPPYFGDGWIGMRLDLGENDWDEIAAWLERSWLSIAPKKLAHRHPDEGRDPALK